MSRPRILNCRCQPRVDHPFQDKTYGKGRRVFNEAPGNKGEKKGRYRCTVCELEVYPDQKDEKKRR